MAEVTSGGVESKAPNPAADVAKTAATAAATPTRRIPMSVPMQSLEVPEISGHNLYWFKESRIERAKAAGYELVGKEEVSLNPKGVGADRRLSGNTDLGTNVSIVAGTDQHGHPERLVLMKIRSEWWNEDHGLLDARNAQIVESIFEGEKVGARVGDEASSSGGTADLPDHAYVRKDQIRGPPILNRKPRKAHGPGRYRPAAAERSN